MKLEVPFPNAAAACDFLTTLSDIPTRGILGVLIYFKNSTYGISTLCLLFSVFFFHFPKNCYSLTGEMVQVLKFSSPTTQMEVEACDSISR